MKCLYLKHYIIFFLENALYLFCFLKVLKTFIEKLHTCNNSIIFVTSKPYTILISIDKQYIIFFYLWTIHFLLVLTTLLIFNILPKKKQNASPNSISHAHFSINRSNSDDLCHLTKTQPTFPRSPMTHICMKTSSVKCFTPDLLCAFLFRLSRFKDKTGVFLETTSRG